MNSIQNDLNTIFDDLSPKTDPTKTTQEESIENTEEKKVSAEDLINKLKDIQRLTQELLAMLQNAPTRTIHPLPVHSPVFRASTTAIPQFFTHENGVSVLEGHFNGEKMIGDDGKEYNVPPNYASKSKLVTGDRMKLTITQGGAFIYKQIGPINRKRVIGTLEFDPEHNHWTVKTSEKNYKVLSASISFYKGKPGDEVILFVPESTPCEWAAVDQLIAI